MKTAYFDLTIKVLTSDNEPEDKLWERVEMLVNQSDIGGLVDSISEPYISRKDA